MFYINRFATERAYNRYTLCIDEDYVIKINDELHKTYKFEGEVTIEDIHALWNRDDTWMDEVEISIEGHSNVYTLYLSDIISDWINDDIWASVCDMIDGETIDWSDEVSED